MNGIEMKNLNSKIGDFTLKDINMLIPQGSILGLVGKNGSGKTTLLNTICGTYLQTSGDLKVNGFTYEENEEELRKSFAMVYDVLDLNPYVKVKFLQKLYSDSNEDFDNEMFVELCEKYELGPNYRIQKLSFGMKKKLMMILALSSKPNVLLLDEPLIGIDPIQKKEFIGLIQDFMDDLNNSVIISSHQVEDIERISDYVAFIDDGKIVLFSDKESLLDKYVSVKLNDNDKAVSKIINPTYTSFGVEGIMDKKEAESNKIEYQRTSIEQIFVHMCK